MLRRYVSDNGKAGEGEMGFGCRWGPGVDERCCVCEARGVKVEECCFT